MVPPRQSSYPKVSYPVEASAFEREEEVVHEARRPAARYRPALRSLGEEEVLAVMTVPVAACASSAVYLPVPDGEGHHVHRPDERGVPKKGRGGRPASERHQDQEQRACGHCDGNQSHECERESAS